MKLVLTLCLLSNLAFGLIGGNVAEMSEWKSSVWKGNCTATVVGEQVVATAAHCVSNGGSISFKRPGETKVYKGKCNNHTDYRLEIWQEHQRFLEKTIHHTPFPEPEFALARNSTSDWSLCKISEKIEGGEYESLNDDQSILTEGMIVTLSGYGCQKWGSGIDGKYRIGSAPVVSLPSGNNHDIVTKGKTALCSGDSGGPMFCNLKDGSRRVCGVNSRSNTTTTSYLPSWAESEVMEWGKAWAEDNGVKICGWHKDAVGCAWEEKPKEPVEFTIETSQLSMKVVIDPSAKYSAEEARAILQKSMNDLGAK